MQLKRLAAQPHLTYCTNIHAGESWDEVSQSLNAFVPAIRDAVSDGAAMGIGLRLSGQGPEFLCAFVVFVSVPWVSCRYSYPLALF